MFRIGLKLSSNVHDPICKIQKYGGCRLYSATRWRGVPSNVNRENRIARAVRLSQNHSRASYSSDASRSERSGGRKGLLFLGSITLGTIGILTLAKNNASVRATLEEWIPGTDRTLKIIFQEENSYFDHILQYFESLKESILGIIGYGTETEKAPEKSTNKLPMEDTKTIPTTKSDQSNSSTPPKSDVVPPMNRREPPKKEPRKEPIQNQDKLEQVPVVKDKPTPPSKKVPEVSKPANLTELETNCGIAATRALDAYQTAVRAVKEYNQDVAQLIQDNTDSNVASSTWKRLKEATEKRKRTVKQAEENATNALHSLKELSNLVDNPQFDATPVMKSTVRRNVKKITDDVEMARKKYEEEVLSSNIAEQFWNKVKVARETFNEELQILFPSLNIHDKYLSVNEEAFDLFVLHMYNKVINLQTELAKLETMGSNSLKAALKSAGDLASEEKINELVHREVQREKRLLQENFEKKVLVERKAFEDELRKQLKLQAQLNADNTKETLEIKEAEMQRLMNRTLTERLEAETNKYKGQLAVIVGRLRGLDDALKVRLSEEKGACDAQVLWSACQALARAVKVGSSASNENPIRSLEAELKAVSKVAPKEDPLVQVTLAAIPPEAVKRGVFPEDALRARFTKVERMARRLALVPEEGASLPIYLLSYLQNFLLIKGINPISKRELLDEPIDVNQLNTFDILNRARYWLDRGDFKMTLRYMNLLKGAPRSVARDWMNETKILLETQLAIDTLLAYAGAIGLVFLGHGDPKSAKN